MTVSLGVATPGIDSQMEAGAYLTGHVMSVAGAGIADAWVEVQDATTRDYLVWAETAADGSFRAGPVASGSFVVRVGAADYLPNWVGGSATPTAVAVTTAQVRAGADVAAGDVALELGGVISGVVTDVVTGDPVRGCVSVYLGAEDWETGDGCAADDGQYRISGLPLGTYQVQFWADGYGTEWFNDKTTRNDANPIAITTSERSATASAALEPSGRVSGRIIDDATGEPITDPADDCLTSVRLWSSGQYVVASTCVAPDGSYSITADSPGIYRLEVRNSGDYATRWYVAATAFAEAAPLALAPRVVLSGTDVRLVPAASISGTITSPGPTDNLSANLYTKPASQSGYPSYVSGATPDATGKYKFRGVTPGTYLVQFQDYSQAAEPRWYTNSATWQGATAVVVGQSQQLTGIDVDLPKAASITLAINGPEGALTTNVCWTLWTSTGSGSGSCGNEPGKVLIKGLSSGQYRLEIKAAGYVADFYTPPTPLPGATDPNTFELAAQQDLDLGRLTLDPGAVIAGTIADETTGAAVSGYVYAYSAASQAGQWVAYSCACSGGGSYRLDTLAPGEYQLYVSPWNGYRSEWFEDKATQAQAKKLTIAADGQVTTANFKVDQGHAISGTVTNSTTAAPIAAGVTASLVTANGQTYAAGTTANGSGAFTLAGLPDGDYILQFTATGMLTQYYPNADAPTSATKVTVSGANVTGISMAMTKAASITATVKDPGGAPIPSVCWMLWSNKGGVGSCRTDGTVLIQSLAAGQYRLEVKAAGYVSKFYTPATPLPGAADPNTFELAAQQDLDLGTVTLQPAAVIAGTITDQNTGAAVSGYVYAYSTATGQTVASAYAGTGGSYRLDSLPAGEYRLYASLYNGYTSEWFEDQTSQSLATKITVAADGTVTTANFKVSTGHSISGTVTNKATSTPIPASVTAYLVGAGGTTQHAGSATANATGQFTINALGNGDYVLYASSTGMESQFYDGVTQPADAKRITITDLDVGGISVKMAKAGSITVKVVGPQGDSCQQAVRHTLDRQRRQQHLRRRGWSAHPDQPSRGFLQAGGSGVGLHDQLLLRDRRCRRYLGGNTHRRGCWAGHRSGHHRDELLRRHRRQPARRRDRHGLVGVRHCEPGQLVLRRHRLHGHPGRLSD